VSGSSLFPGQPWVAGQTIHGALLIPTRGVLKKHLLGHVMARRTIRRSRHASPKRNGLGQIKDAVSASGWPELVEDRSLPGLGEGDLIEQPRNGCVATLVDNHSRHPMLCKVDNKDIESVVSPLIKKSTRLLGNLIRPSHGTMARNSNKKEWLSPLHYCVCRSLTSVETQNYVMCLTWLWHKLELGLTLRN